MPKEEKDTGVVGVDEMARRMGHDGSNGPIKPIEHKPLANPVLIPRPKNGGVGK